MGYRIFITGSGITSKALLLLEEQGCVVEVGDPLDGTEDIARKLSSFNPDGIIVRQGQITADVLAAAPQLRVISKHGVGTDNIDVAAATARGIPVTMTPGTTHESAAEHTLALMLALARRVPLLDRQIRNGRFDKRGYDGQELLGKTLGIIGFGRIGRRLMELVAPLTMKVLVYHPSSTEETLPPLVTKVSKVEEVFTQADIVSLHCTLGPETKRMINKHSLAQMKRGAVLINTARGGLVNESDLVDALQDGQLSGAALDVFEQEPPADDNPLLRLDNVIATAHVGGASDTSLTNTGLAAVRNALLTLQGERLDPAYVVNWESHR